MLGELPLDKYVTHDFSGLDKVNDLVHTMHQGSCLRGVLTIHDTPAKDPEDIKVISSVKHGGGYLKMVEHWSRVNNCKMSFGIFLPEDCVSKQRVEPYPAIYFLNGLGRMHSEGPDIL